MSIKVSCPTCKTKLKVNPPPGGGKVKIKCPTCKTSSSVTLPAATVANLSAPAAPNDATAVGPAPAPPPADATYVGAAPVAPTDATVVGPAPAAPLPSLDGGLPGLDDAPLPSLDGGLPPLDSSPGLPGLDDAGLPPLDAPPNLPGFDDAGLPGLDAAPPPTLASPLPTLDGDGLPPLEAAPPPADDGGLPTFDDGGLPGLDAAPPPPPVDDGDLPAFDDGGLPGLDAAPPPPPVDDGGLPGLDAAPLPPPVDDGGLPGLDDAPSPTIATPLPDLAASVFHVKRRSGKIFGPFDEPTLVQMLGEGQLLGNEELSEDRLHWAPLDSRPALAEAVQRVLESNGGLLPEGLPGEDGLPPPADGEGAGEALEAPPGDAPPGEVAAAAQGPIAGVTEEQNAAMERVNKLYEGRMAAVTVVDHSKDTARLRKRIQVAVAAVLGILVFATGLGLGATRYGVFGIKKLFPRRVSASSSEGQQLEAARAALLSDTYKGYRDARDTTGKLLQETEYPLVRAVWDQAVFYLERRYAAGGGDMARALESLEQIELLGENDPDVIKAVAGSLLAAKDAPGALAVLQRGDSGDVELQFLLAEAYAAQKNSAEARATLEKVLAAQPESAKAHHALGMLLKDSGDSVGAAASFQRALSADSKHLSSAVELAAVELLLRKDEKAATAALDRNLDEANEQLLGPAHRALAHGMRGLMLLRQHKPNEALQAFEQASRRDPKNAFVQANQGAAQLALRNYDASVALLKSAIEREPGDLNTVENYILALIGKGDFGTAPQVLKTAQGRFANNPRVAYLSGRVNDALDNAIQAEADYKKAIAAENGPWEAHLYLGRFYLHFRRVKEARPPLEAAVQKAPREADAHAGMGELLLTENVLDQARASFQKAIELDPNLPESYLGLARVALEEGKHDEALTQVDAGLQREAALRGARLVRGDILWKQRNLDGALAEYEQAKAQDPKNAKISQRIGAVKIEKKDYAGAEGILTGSINADPSDPDTHFYLAKVKNLRAEHAQAIDAMKNALDRSPQRLEFRLEMGRILRDAAKLTEAISEWQQALKIAPGNPAALEYLGEAFLERGENDKALEQFREILKSAPDRPGVLGRIAECQYRSSRWSDAIEAFEAALAADPKLAGGAFKVGQCYTNLGKPKQAVEWYQKAAEADAKFADTYQQLGFALKQLGQKKPAADAFRRYLEARPGADDKKMVEDEIHDLEH